MKRIKFHFYHNTPTKNVRVSWSINIFPIIQLAYFQNENIEFILGWIFWEFEIRFLLKEKE